MNNKICFYKLNGTLKDEVAFNEENLKISFGMKVRCVFEDGTEKIGYACCNDNYYKNNMIDCIGNFELWTLKKFNIDKPNMVYEQEFTPVDLTNIERIDAILHSNPRWGLYQAINLNLQKIVVNQKISIFRIFYKVVFNFMTDN